jgi:hypothetical protein
MTKKLKRKLLFFLGCSLKEVAYWCVKVDPENLESLVDERMKGNYQTNRRIYKIIIEKN